jgi:1-acyl-sn-glycerol-3-phosphate acyltransferase
MTGQLALASTAEFKRLLKEEGRYVSGPPRARGLNAVPGVTPLRFYGGIIKQVLLVRWHMRKQRPMPATLFGCSIEIARSIEALGGVVEITGAKHLNNLDGAAVFVGNHMSSLETFMLPGFIMPFSNVTFVLKEVLLDYPVYGRILRHMECIGVTRTDARADLRTVMQKGGEALAAGRSVVIFPQTTRTTEFSADDFNSLGVKLASRAGVPVVPVALKTDLWGNGKLIKDLGQVRPQEPVRFAFGAPLTIEGKGREQHAECVAFISRHLDEWNAKDSVQSGT